MFPISWKKAKERTYDPNGKGVSIAYEDKEGKKKYFKAEGRRGYGFGFVLPNDFLAIDSDTEDGAWTNRIMEELRKATGRESLPLRLRNGSNRFATILKVEDAAELAKGEIELPDGKNIDVLAGGDFCMAAGVHPSGSRYRWEGGNPGDFVQVTCAQVDAFLQAMTSSGARWVPGKAKGAGTGEYPVDPEFQLEDDALASWLNEQGMVIGHEGNRVFIQCPWNSEHTGTDKPQDAVYFSGGRNGPSGFKCLHGHCVGRRFPDLLKWAREQGFSDAGFKRVEAEEGTAEAAEVPAEDLAGIVAHFITDGGKFREWCETRLTKEGEEVLKGFDDSNVLSEELARSSGIIGKNIRYDGFTKSWTDGHGNGMDIELATYQLGKELERASLQVRGKLVPLKNTMQKKLGKFLFASGKLNGERRTDSLSVWMQSLPAWDGTRRARTIYQDALHCRTFETDGGQQLPENLEGGQTEEYLEAVGEYTLAAMAARWAVTDGVGAHVIPVFVGEQKGRKGTFLKALAAALPKAGYVSPVTDSVGGRDLYGSADFGEKTSNFCRFVAGKAVVEFEEMGGYSKRDLADLKKFVTKDIDEWDVKFINEPAREPRRWFGFGSTNDTAFLRRSGDIERRFAPIYVQSTMGRPEEDAARVRDIERITSPEVFRQLIAEGLHLYREVGLDRLTARVEELLSAPQAAVSEELPHADRLRDWLEGPEAPRGPFTTSQAFYALGLMDTRKSQLEVAAALRSIGYERRAVRISGEVVKRWSRRK